MVEEHFLQIFSVLTSVWVTRDEVSHKLMVKISKLIILFSILLVSCGPKIYHLDQDTVYRLESEMKVYDASELSNLSYTRLGSVEGVSCKLNRFSPTPSEGAAIVQLFYKASLLGANGLTDVLCERDGLASLAKNCFSSITCQAVAINVEIEPPKPPTYEY